jgi:hypothetical protein
VGAKDGQCETDCAWEALQDLQVAVYSESSLNRFLAEILSTVNTFFEGKFLAFALRPLGRPSRRRVPMAPMPAWMLLLARRKLLAHFALFRLDPPVRRGMVWSSHHPNRDATWSFPTSGVCNYERRFALVQARNGSLANEYPYAPSIFKDRRRGYSRDFSAHRGNLFRFRRCRGR